MNLINNSDEGFTVLEALVSFAIILMLSLVVMRGVSQGLVNGGRASETLQAAIVASNVLNEHSTSTSLGQNSGKTDGGFSWEVTEMPVDHTNGIHDKKHPLSLISVRVFNKFDAAPLFELKTLQLISESEK